MHLKQLLYSFLGRRGFSLAETMISAALLGGVGVVMLNLDDSQSVDETFSETDMIIETLYQGIYLAMEDPEVCTKTLGGKGTTITDGTEVTIPKRDGTSPPLAGKGIKDSRDMIEITSMKTKLPSTFPIPNHNYAEIDIEVTFKKLGRQLAEASGGTEREITHSIPLQLDLETGSTKLESCFLPSTESANTLICRQFFGTYDHQTQECTLPFYGKSCIADGVTNNHCHRSMATFDSSAQFGCVTTSIEPNDQPSCPW